MLENFKGDVNTFTYKKLSKEEMESRGILGRLIGVIADTKKPTRNGRLYGKELWENVFNSDLMQEKIDARVVLAELGHPADRQEIDAEKVCACLAEKPKLADDGKIYGVFDILSTPNGKLLKTLCDYGCHVGISSRGSGDVYDDGDGEYVDPETYNCECWDVVLVPAVKEARLQYVTESLSKKRYNKTLKEALLEKITSASDDDKKVMEKTLNELEIDLDTAEEAAKVDDVDSVDEDENVADLVDKDEVLSPRPNTGSILPVLVANKAEDIYNAALLNGYADICERIAASKGIALENAIGSSNRNTLNVLRYFIYGSILLVLGVFVYKKYFKKVSKA